MANLKRGLNGTQLEILKLVHGYLTHMRVDYSLMSQAWMLKQLDKWYGHKISRSTFSYNIRYLKRHGYLDVKTRHWNNPETKKFEPRVSRYKMTTRLKFLFMGWATYFRNIGWKNYISKGKRYTVKVEQDLVGAAMTAGEFFTKMRRSGICPA